jgi:hypothetical protein
MKRLNYTIFLMTLIIAMLSGCAQMGPGGTFDCPDADNDGICNQYEKNGSSDNLGGDTTPVECKKDDGSTVYLDCSLTTDCNCNGIADNEEKSMTEGCGWGCVSSNARTWVMVGTALLGAYIAGQYVHWPNWPWDKDNQGNDYKEYTVNSIDWGSATDRKSYINFRKDSHFELHIEGSCKYTTKDGKSADFPCKLDMTSKIFSGLPSTYNYPSETSFYMEYGFDLSQTPIFGRTEQYIKVQGEVNEGYVKDPNWLGFDTTYNKARTKVTLREPNNNHYNKLAFNEAEDVLFAWGQNSLEANNYLFYYWNRTAQ